RIALLIPALGAAQTIPVRLGDPVNLIAPAATSDGVVFAASMSPGAVPLKATNLFVSGQPSPRQLTNYTNTNLGAGVTGISCSGAVAAYGAAPSGMGAGEEVHIIDIATATDRKLATDTQGCIFPLCIECVRPCVGPVHLNTDATKVLYAAAREQPFYVVNADG